MTDLDIAALRDRIATRWLQLSGEAMLPGMLEWAYREVLVLIASWVKIDLELAISDTFSRYSTEVQALPYAGNSKDSIIALAKAYSDVRDVNISVTTPNVVNVFLLAETGTPTSGQMQGLQDYLNSDRVRNVCDTYTVASATEVIWNSQLSIVVSGNLTTISNAVASAISAYATSKQYLGTTIRLSEIVSQARSVSGVVDVTIVSPAANVSTTAAQFPKLGTNVVNAIAG